MKLYLTTWIDDDYQGKGETQSDGHWDGTQADAKATRKAATAEMMRNIETKEVDVPTSKAELIAFLNDKGVL